MEDLCHSTWAVMAAAIGGGALAACFVAAASTTTTALFAHPGVLQEAPAVVGVRPPVAQRAEYLRATRLPTSDGVQRHLMVDGSASQPTESAPPVASGGVSGLIGGLLVGALLAAVAALTGMRNPARPTTPLACLAVAGGAPAGATSFPKIKLTYFAIEGAAEKVRLALTLAGIPFEDEYVDFKSWPQLKPGTKYGQLPLMTVDGGAPIAQSEAMLRYVGRLGGLYPEDKALVIDELMGLIGDMAKAWMPAMYMGMKPSMFGYADDFNKTAEGQALIKRMREQFAATELPRFLAYFEKALAGHAFLVGDEPTIADCMLVPMLRGYARGTIEHLPTTCLDGHPNVTAYIDRFLALPQIKAWYAAKSK